MRKEIMTRSILVGASFVLASFSLQAQTVSTPVVGFQKTSLSANAYKGIGISLLNPSVITGSVSGKSGYVVTLTGASGLGASLENAPASYYLEVTSGANVGDRFDVDVSATKSANNATITLASNSRNTANAQAVNLASGSGVVVRKHVTLDQVRSSLAGTLRGDDNSYANADVLYVHNGITFVGYWLGSDLQSWWSNDDPDDHRFDVIGPGQGILFYKKGSAATFTSVGSVRPNDYKQVLSAGYQLNAPGYPLSYTPVALGGSLSNGWNAGDKIFVHDGLAYNANTLMSDGTSVGYWDDGVNPDPVNSTVLVSGDSSFLTYLSNPVTDIETKPTQ